MNKEELLDKAKELANKKMTEESRSKLYLDNKRDFHEVYKK